LATPRPAPRTTLFPYTTLFRSDQADDGKPTDLTAHLARGVPGAEPPLEKQGAIGGARDKTAAGFHSIYETGRFGFKEMGVKRSLDRKSTRLNSSHLVISYAVFC